MNNTPQLILTVDYELFGDGSGCIDACVLEPATRMMNIANRFGAAITFFVEALEFIEFEQYLHDLRVRNQLKDALRSGHDMQLHLHPQWLGAKLQDNGIWSLDLLKWRIGNLDEKLIERLVLRGKQWLEDVIDDPEWRCVAFRAGGWCIQPSDRLLPVLNQAGIKIDTSVAPGLWNASPGEWYDFRAVPSKSVWRIKKNVCAEDSNGKLLEVPITTGCIRKIEHLKALKQSGLAENCMGSYQGVDGAFGRFIGKMSKLSRLGHVMLDFSTMPADVLISITEMWLSRHKLGIGALPIVAIAHTKNFTESSEKALSGYLSWAEKRGIVFSTYPQWLKDYSNG